MFKKAVLFTGLFAIAACSGDVYDEIDEQNALFANQQNNANTGGMQTNSFEDSNPGWINFPGGGGFPFINTGSGCQSPWDIWFRNHPFTPIYTFSNRGGGGHSSPLKLEIIPWAGLAYYDDNNDGIYNDLANPGTSFNLAGGNYPNLFFNNQEVGNLVPGDPITLDGSSIDESELTIASDPSLTQDEHLLANPANKLGPYNNLNKVFSFSILTPQEQDLLMKYGKVLYYEVRISERVSGLPIGTYRVQYKNTTLKNPATPPNHYVQIMPYKANMIPSGGILSNNVYYYYNPSAPNDTQWGTPGGSPYPTSPNPPGTPNPNFICNSREVVIEQFFPDQTLISYGSPQWQIYVTMPIGSYLWQTSGPMLVVGP